MGRVKRKTQYLVSIIPMLDHSLLRRLFSVFYPCLLGVVRVDQGSYFHSTGEEKFLFRPPRLVYESTPRQTRGSTPQWGAMLGILADSSGNAGQNQPRMSNLLVSPTTEPRFRGGVAGLERHACMSPRNDVQTI